MNIPQPASRLNLGLGVPAKQHPEIRDTSYGEVWPQHDEQDNIGRKRKIVIGRAGARIELALIRSTPKDAVAPSWVRFVNALVVVTAQCGQGIQCPLETRFRGNRIPEKSRDIAAQTEF